jgi:beta-glucanase (GH16 family)
MKNNIIKTIFLLALFTNILDTKAQNCQGIEPVFFGGTINCSTSPYKLVFFDDFNGNSLNTSKWYTYGPTWPNNDDQSLFSRTHDVATLPSNFKEVQIYRDENVIVSNGTVKLRAKNETSSWFGVTKNYTSGYLQAKTPFKYGKVEIRIKLPERKWLLASCLVVGNGTKFIFSTN